MIETNKLPTRSRAGLRTPPARIRIKGVQNNVAIFGPLGQAEEVWRKQLKTVFGTASDAFVDMSLHHLMCAARMPGAGPSELAINGALAHVASFAPRNEMEAALAVQSACTHMVIMVMFARIGGGHGGPHRLPGLGSTAAKLLRASCSQIETFRRLRGGGGDQNIRVEHVHVHDGGQAIVGVVSRGPEARG